jgi:MtN3 and saliva related transmembrane protein
MANVWVITVGSAATLCSMVSFAPQLIKIVRDRNAEAVSLRMYLVTVTGFGFWIAYGLMITSWPVVVSNSVCLTLSGAILVLKWRLLRPSGAPPARGPA